MNIPTLQQARAFLAEAEDRNPGPWVQHSIFVAQAAEAIAACHPDLSATDACILGYLHDIGRGAGPSDMRHALDGYVFLHSRGFDDAARICLTHSFPVQDIRAVAGTWDCTPEEMGVLETQLLAVQYDEYDRLIQLCDALALPEGFCLLEKRLIDVSLRRGVNERTVPRWRAFLQLQRDFERAIGRSLYSVLPGVIENTFGYDPTRSAIRSHVLELGRFIAREQG